MRLTDKNKVNIDYIHEEHDSATQEKVRIIAIDVSKLQS